MRNPDYETPTVIVLIADAIAVVQSLKKTHIMKKMHNFKDAFLKSINEMAQNYHGCKVTFIVTLKTATS